MSKKTGLFRGRISSSQSEQSHFYFGLVHRLYVR